MIDNIRRFAVVANEKTGKREFIASPMGGKGSKGYVKSKANQTTAADVVAEISRKETITADAYSGMGGGGGGYDAYGGFSVGQVVVAKNIMSGYLDDFLPPGDLRVRRRMYRDIYYHDAIAGSSVDLHAILPWSNFTLSGIKDRDVMDKYHKSVENLRLKITLPAISRDYLAMGAFAGSTTFDKDLKIFTSLFPHNLDFLDIVEVPIAGIDPLVNMRIPDNLSRLLKDTQDPRVRNIMQALPDNIKKGLRAGSVPLQPENLLYIPRRTLSTDSTGTSYFERILPIYLMEKSLFRGSIDQIYRRQRAIMHITVTGDGDDYVPSPQDLENYRDLFLCLTGDTLVSKNNKLVRLDSICSKEGKKKNEGEKINITIKGKDGKLVQAKKWWYRGKSNTQITTTQNGYCVDTTGSHKIQVLKEDLSLGWKKAEKLRLGDFLCLDTNLARVENKEIINFTINKLSKPKRGCPTPKVITTPTTMTPELAYIIALIISEGEITKHAFRITNTDKNIIEHLTYCVKKVFNIDPEITWKDEIGKQLIIEGTVSHVTKICATFRVHSILVCSILNQLGVKFNKELCSNPLLYKRCSHYKTIPWSILQADDASKYSFIAGYVDGDGRIYTSKIKDGEGVDIKIHSKSKELLKQFQIMLLDLGFRSLKNEDYFFLQVNSSTAYRLYSKIKPYNKHKEKIFDVTHESKDMRLGIPMKFIARFLESRHETGNYTNCTNFLLSDTGERIPVKRWKSFILMVKLASWMLYDSLNSPLNNKILEIIKQLSPDFYNNIQELIKIKYFFDPVVKLEKSKKKVDLYDLSIEDNAYPAFVANGIVVHNSADMDPTGAVIVTRGGVQPNEIRDAGQFFRIDELFEFFCLTGDTLIPTSKGLLRIDEMGEIDGDRIQDINIKVSGDVGISKAVKFLNQGTKPVCKVKLKNGIQIKSTFDHRYLTYSSKINTLMWKEAKNLRKGDLLCCNRQKNVRQDVLEINLSDQRLDHRLIKPTKMTTDLAFILGCLVSEGCFDQNSVRFHNSNKNLLYKYSQCMKRVFGLDTKEVLVNTKGSDWNIKGRTGKTTCDYYSVILNNRNLCLWLKELGLTNQGKNGKKPCLFKQLPWSIRHADEQAQLSYFAGYIEGDGHITKAQGVIGITSGCAKNLRQMQSLLACHGISSSIGGCENKQLILQPTDGHMFFDSIAPYMVEKSVISERFLKNRKCGVPAIGIKKFLESRLTKIHYSKYVLTTDAGEEIVVPRWRELVHNIFNYKIMTYDSFKDGKYEDFLNILKLVSETEYNKVIRLFNAKYNFVEVQKIVDLKRFEKVYDLNIDEKNSPAFVANGIVVHNCSAKYRALNINEQFITGDSSFATMDASMSVFVEQLRSYREMLTREIFYQKIYPAIAVANEFRKDRYMVTGSAARNVRRKYIHGSPERGYKAYCDDTRHGINFFGHEVDLDSLALPNMVWEKHLKPEGDDSYLNLLQTLSQLGVPVPITMMAAAGGISLDAILNGMDDELKVRKRLEKYNSKLEKYAPSTMMQGGQDDGGDQDQYQAQASLMKILAGANNNYGSTKPVGILRREYDERLLPHNQSKTGKYKLTSKREQQRIYERLNKVVAAAAANQAKKHNASIKSEKKENRKVMSHGTYGIVK